MTTTMILLQPRSELRSNEYDFGRRPYCELRNTTSTLVRVTK